MNENVIPESTPEVSQEFLDEIAAGANDPGTNAVTPPDPFMKVARRSRSRASGNAVTPPDPF